MDEGLFEDLLESIQEAGAILRGEREATRRTILTEEMEGAGLPEVVEQGGTFEQEVALHKACSGRTQGGGGAVLGGLGGCSKDYLQKGPQQGEG